MIRHAILFATAALGMSVHLCPLQADEGQQSEQDTAIHVPTPHDVIAKMLEAAKVTEQDVLFDLGCGDGRIVIAAATRYGCRAVGYDIDARKVKESQANVAEKDIGGLVKIEQRDIFKLDLSKATVITLYLLPEMNAQLIPQLRKLRDGSRIVTHDFPIEGIAHDRKLSLESAEDGGPHDVYLYVTPLKIAK